MYSDEELLMKKHVFSACRRAIIHFPERTVLKAFVSTELEMLGIRKSKREVRIYFVAALYEDEKMKVHIAPVPNDYFYHSHVAQAAQKYVDQFNVAYSLGKIRL